MIELNELYQIFVENPLISIDTRTLEAGSIYFALRGANFNGNDYALDAIEKGATYAVVDDSSLQNNERILYVEDVLTALQNLAQLHRRTLNIPVIAITGTNGKTTTKELSAEVLKSSYNLLYTQGNLNNHIGVPLTLLKMTKEHQLALIEMGANKRGDIAELCAIAEPNYGIVTNIGLAHLEGFGDLEGVATTKGELFEFLKAHNGIAFFKEEDERLATMVKGLPAISYGEVEEATIVGDRNVGEDNGKESLTLKFRWQVPSQEDDVHMQSTNLVGAYNLDNCLVAISLGVYFDVPTSDIVRAINLYKPNNSRSQLVEGGKNKLIVDAYNANPTSMAKAIENFSLHKVDMPQYLILGAMKELGEASAKAHQEIYQLVLDKKFDLGKVYLCGKEWEEALGNDLLHCFEDVEALKVYLLAHSIENAFILVKGSNSIKLNNIIDIIS